MILVTGGTGLVGAHLLLRLTDDNRKVRAIFRNEKNISKTKNLFEIMNKENLFSKIEWFKADLNDVPELEEAFIDITEVYHCAAMVTFTGSENEKMQKVNIEGTANMVNLSLAFDVEKFCHISSIATLDETIIGTNLIDETSNWNPNGIHSDYAISKFGGETEVWRAAQEGLNVVIVNPGVIFGIGFPDQGSGEIITKMKSGFPFYTDGKTGVVSANDVVSCMIGLMDNNIFNQRFILVSENISYKDLFEKICNLLNKKTNFLEAKKWMLAIAWRMDWLLTAIIPNKKRSLSRDLATASFTKDLYKNDLIKKTLNFEFETSDKFLKDIILKQI
ncbi:NAD-dependent epimerase/dehydratase family protein [Flavobacterium sp. I3-2]|uniref:NAD-dependent epimerase/dehydratase family protein n=1 Tax=Flavobacterium sp. I3-2 TaxID=2748319 RepID=UPI0015AA3B3E|nr:NAD-dependent epimerase/dehydratase family protein [Flavobacterium sp. I3-2]